MHWFHNRSTLAKLLGAFSFVCALLVGVGAFGLWTAQGIKANLDSVAKEQLPSTKALDNVRQVELRILRDVLALPQGEARTTLVTTTVPASIKALDDGWLAYTGMPLDAEEKRLTADYVELTRHLQSKRTTDAAGVGSRGQPRAT